MSAFLLTTIVISLSGVMAPGPITAAALAAGAKARHAGAMIAIGHAAVEFPLIAVLVAGVGPMLQSHGFRIAIGFGGGVFLLWMAAQLLLGARTTTAGSRLSPQRRPFATGVVLTGANPYFLVWWATVGLTLTNEAVGFGIGALLLFAMVHWLCDLGWLEFLSLVGNKGAGLFGDRSQRAVSAVCGAALLGFGAKFIYDAGAGAAMMRW
ncbi:MAG: LysE family transporter [Pirellulales bacterium]|nr:LysE family transporter [Pirellulales bacterium]